MSKNRFIKCRLCICMSICGKTNLKILYSWGLLRPLTEDRTFAPVSTAILQEVIEWREIWQTTTVDTLGDYMLHSTISLFRFAYNHLNEFVHYDWLQLCLSECLSELINHCKGWCACKRRWTLPAGDANCRRTLLQPRVMMKDCFPTRLHSVSLDTEHLKTHVSSSVEKSNYTDINIHVW